MPEAKVSPYNHLSVDLSHPPGAQSGKGPAVRRLKGYMSWVRIIYTNMSF